MTAELELSGAPVNAFGKDIKDLVLEVEYQTEHRTSSSAHYDQDTHKRIKDCMCISEMLRASNTKLQRTDYLDLEMRSPITASSNSISRKTRSHSVSPGSPQVKSCSILSIRTYPSTKT